MYHLAKHKTQSSCQLKNSAYWIFLSWWVPEKSLLLLTYGSVFVAVCITLCRVHQKKVVPMWQKLYHQAYFLLHTQYDLSYINAHSKSTFCIKLKIHWLLKIYFVSYELHDLKNIFRYEVLVRRTPLFCIVGGVRVCRDERPRSCMSWQRTTPEIVWEATTRKIGST